MVFGAGGCNALVPSDSALVLYVAAVVVPIVLIIARLIAITPFTSSCGASQSLKQVLAEDPANPTGDRHLMVLLGSGGHTGEMIRLLDSLDVAEYSRTYVCSSGDSTSLGKAMEFEESLTDPEGLQHTVAYMTLLRARSVGESLPSSVYSTLCSFVSTLSALAAMEHKPHVLLVNGPGTSVPLAWILFFIKFLGLGRTRIVYVESLARVSSLSLSGLLILPIADRFIVQWEQLYHRYRRAEYYGILV